MEMSNNLAKALAAAQAEMKNAPLNRTNPHFKSKYADLAAIRDATVPVLAKHGLSIVQYTKMCDGTLMLHTRLLHESGEYLEGEYPLPAAYDKPQVMGSAYTYAKRYSWSAMLGVSAEDDDDGNAGQGAKPNIAERPEPRNKSTRDADWMDGPCKTREDLRKMAGAFTADLNACNDLDMLAGLERSYAAFLKQLQHNSPSWWDSETDPPGMKQRIERMHRHLAAEDARRTLAA